MSGNVTLSGTGRVILRDAASDQILGDTSDQIPDQLTNALGHTIEGAGLLGLDSLGLNNQGLIDANLGQLTIDVSGSVFANTGTLRASTGSTLDLSDSTATNDGRVEIQAGGIVGAASDFTQSVLGTLAVELGPNSFGLLNAGGTANLAGSLEISLVSGFTPTIGQSFDVVTGTAVVDNGLIVVDNNPGDGINFSAQVNGGVLTVTVVEESGGFFTGDSQSPGQSSGFQPINPRATYLRTNIDTTALDTVPFALASILLSPGTIATLRQFGAYQDAVGSPEISTDTVAVFSQTDVLLAQDQLNRVEGAVDAGVDFVTLDTLDGNPTDIPEDFFLPNIGFGSPLHIAVPDGATHLFVAPNDSLYDNNDDPNGDYGFQIDQPGIAGVNGQGNLIMGAGDQLATSTVILGLGPGSIGTGSMIGGQLQTELLVLASQAWERCPPPQERRSRALW